MPGLGRNDPCHCGSGKKYKKCHLASDEEADRARRAAAAAPIAPAAPVAPAVPTSPDHAAIPPAAPARTPEQERADAFWEHFSKASLDEKLAIANDKVATEASLEGEDVIELAIDLVEPLRFAGRWTEADALIDAIEARHPAAYAAEAGWFLYWRVERALLGPGGGDVRAPLLAWAERLDLPDMMIAIVDRLRYHDRLEDLALFANAVWPRAKDSADLLPHASDEWQSVGVLTALGRLLASDAALTAEDPRVRDALAPFGGLRLAWIADYVAIDSGAREPNATAADVVARGARGAAALDELAIAFGRALRVEHGWPRGRADVARETMRDMLFERHDQLVEAAPKRQAAAPPRGRQRAKPTAASTAPAVDRVVMPDKAFLNTHLAKYASPFGVRGSRLAAHVAALPAWIAFVTARGLLPAERVESARAELAPLVDTLDTLLARSDLDATLMRDVRAAWARA